MLSSISLKSSLNDLHIDFENRLMPIKTKQQGLEYIRNYDLGVYSYLSPVLPSVPLSRRLPQQHKSSKVLFVTLATMRKASHIQIIGDNSCRAAQYVLIACQNIRQNSIKPSQQADVSERGIEVILRTNQKKELSAAPDQCRYLVGPCARFDDCTILLDRG
jgi:hypothetical protein